MSNMLNFIIPIKFCQSGFLTHVALPVKHIGFFALICQGERSEPGRQRLDLGAMVSEWPKNMFSHTLAYLRVNSPSV